MQRRLILLRHAKSSWDNSRLQDIERPLNKRGNNNAPAMGRLLADRGIRPDRVLSSDAVRARTTAELVSKELGFPLNDIGISHALYLASASTLLDVADQLAAKSSTLMLVAHNPGMTDLSNRLSTTRIDNLPTCGVFVVDAEADNWSDFADGRGAFVGFWCPKNDL